MTCQALGSSWQASPRSDGLALTKGKAAVGGSGTVTTLATDTTGSTPGTGIVTPDGVIYSMDLTASPMTLRGYNPVSKTFFTCADSTGTTTVTGASNTMSSYSITNNGYKIYYPDGDVAAGSLVSLTVTPVPGAKGAGSATNPTCATGVLATNLATLPITTATTLMEYANGKIYFVDTTAAVAINSVATDGTVTTVAGSTATGTTPLTGGTCAAANFIAVYGMVVTKGIMYVYAVDSTTGSAIFMVNLACAGLVPDVVLIAGSDAANGAHLSATTGTAGTFQLVNGGFAFASSMALVGDFLYVGDGFGVTTVCTKSPYAIGDYVVGSGVATASGTSVDGVGSYGTFYYVQMVGPSSGKTSGNLWVFDTDGATNNVVRQVKWSGAAKSKVKSGKKI